MKILYVITKTERGGAQQHVRDLAIAFQSLGNTVAVATGEGTGWLCNELKMKQVPIVPIRLRRTWNPIAFVFYLIDLKRLVQTAQPDIVHFHSSHTLIGTLLIHFFFPSTKSVVTIHGLSVLHPGFASRAERFIYSVYVRFVLQFANEVVCVSEFDQNALIQEKLVSKDRTFVIHNGIAVPDFLSADRAREQLGLSKTDIVIGSIARFSYSKNLLFLIDAFAKWNHPSAQLCLIGNGPEEALLKKHVANLGLQNRVVFQQGDATLLKAFSVFVLSSRHEGFPYALLEAVLADVPIIATNVGGVSELIEPGQTGLLVPSQNVEALAQALNDAVTQSAQSQSYAHAAHMRVQTQFTKELMVQKLEELYQLILCAQDKQNISEAIE